MQCSSHQEPLVGWFGKQAHLNTNPVTLGEGWQLITQAITEWCIEPRRPSHPHSIQPASLPFNFCTQDQSPQTAKHKMQLNDGKQLGLTQGCGTRNKTMHYKKARTKARGNETSGPPHPHCPHPHQIMGLRVTKFQCRLPPQCQWGPIALEVQVIHTMADNAAGSPEVTWRSTCQSSKMRTWKMPSPTKDCTGIQWCIIMLGAKTTPFSPMLSIPYKVTQGSWWEVGGQTLP